MKEHRPVNRLTRTALAALAAASLILAPTPAGASDENLAVATNEVDGAAVVDASVQYRIAPNGVVDEENRAYAAANCVGCQTVAAAFQIVLVTREFREFVPVNEAFAANVACAECLTWASAKQIIVIADGPATLSGNGHLRMHALEGRLEAIEADLPALSLVEVMSALDGAFAELLDIARTEVRTHDGGAIASEVAATRSS
jgi:putative peptide zinc metalloprotease protein